MVKTYMCIRRLEPDGMTEKLMHCDSVAQIDYAALEIERDARAAGEQKAIEYSIKLQRLIENLKYDTAPLYPELHHHKMIVAAKARIASLEPGKAEDRVYCGCLNPIWKVWKDGSTYCTACCNYQRSTSETPVYPYQQPSGLPAQTSTTGVHPNGGPCIHVWALTNRDAVENGRCCICGQSVANRSVKP